MTAPNPKRVRVGDRVLLTNGDWCDVVTAPYKLPDGTLVLGVRGPARAREQGAPDTLVVPVWLLERHEVRRRSRARAAIAKGFLRLLPGGKP